MECARLYSISFDNRQAIEKFIVDENLDALLVSIGNHIQSLMPNATLELELFNCCDCSFCASMKLFVNVTSGIEDSDDVVEQEDLVFNSVFEPRYSEIDGRLVLSIR